MKQLIDTHKAPPSGWRFVDPDTGFKFRRLYRSFADLVGHVSRYRRHNGLPRIPKLEMFIQKWMCDQPNMERYCHEVAVIDRSLAQYLEGAKAAIKMWIEGDRSFVLSEVAEARAALCVKCRHNKRNIKDSKLLRYTDKYVRSVVGTRTTSMDEGLFSCEICSCPLRPKVHISQTIVEESITLKERKALEMGLWDVEGKLFDCWQIKPVVVEEGE